MTSGAERPDLRHAVERHYDSLALLYRLFWGEHVHHGLWPARGGSPRDAQIRLVSHLADRAGIAGGERVLDVGCGYGASARWLAANHGCRVTGITISRVQARHAIRRTRRAGLDDELAVIRGDAAALPITHRSFDVVWVVECLEHLAAKGEFIRRAARTLVPGGRLALCSWQDGNGGADPVVEAVCDAFLCPSLATAAEHRAWCEEAALEVRCQEDLTARVLDTWKILERRVSRPWVRPLRWLVGNSARRFVDGFPIIARAYETGAMSYGLLVARRPA